ncbi:DUF948 domain-containing protein [Shouchella clausii]|uniref:DUF948 domain-containing protein n=1 Tax=Shouchella TaxID=2893057 RepID=UPI0007869998|nr:MULTISPECIES: DUF948 domain-containing protein [Shouchella]PAD41421.1 DUF948 domain-containing protein [Bacillus sp. 7520-S]MBU8597657.1 DUF948 domain-containing protein [Shouchella clausii]MCY1105252.1 DUF948 domain-containing protein [Shouchella clausii]MED4160789.1 DUF948 domain-containing protein [Shouchella clausii]MED4177639.1 DUF948 domain-containing protein [Shouchella clausii]
MEAILYISALIVALAFAILVIYLIKTLKSATKTLENTSATVEALEKQLRGITTESELLLKKTNALADDLQQKSESLNTVFGAAKELGESMKTLNQSVHQVSVKISDQTSRNAETVSQAVQWGQAVLDFYTKFKQRKQQLDR